MKKNRVVVLGHTGLLGSKIYNKYKIKNRKVIGFSSKNCDFRNIKDFQSSIKNLLNNSSVIFTAGKHRKYGSTKKLYIENINIIKNLINLCKKNKPKKIIFISTVEVYKPKGSEYISEKTKTNPINLYAKGKLFQENLLKKFCKENEISLLILRLPGFYSAQDNNLSIVSKLISCCVNNIRFLLKTTGNEKRDYVYLSDVVKIIYFLEKKKFKIDILNIVKGSSISINDLVYKINLIFSKEIKFKKTKIKKNFNLIFDNSKLKKYIKNFHFIKIEDGIKKYKNA